MQTILEAIGHTPLIQLTRSVPPGSAKVFAKLERFNPGGSSKDRVVLRILGEAEKAGKIRPGGTVVAGTTGNAGISLAAIGNIKKYKVILTMPENFSLERRRILECYGADVRLTPAEEGVQGATSRAKRIAEETGALLFSQFEDPDAATAHEATTAKEILNALNVPIDAFVAGVGTGATITGVGRALKKQGAKIVAVEPAASPVLSGGKPGPHKIQGIGAGFVPAVLDRSLIDEIVTISDDEAFEAAQEVARKEGILAGLSSGAAFAAARRVAAKLSPEQTVVTVFGDGAERYFSMRKYFQK